ncbi:MAG: hypothetical protein LKJ88_04655 [Bacilli bacterium]|jgi:hypothetical protein|nr:hypothetical protein [Bacilli bacterium]
MPEKRTKLILSMRDLDRGVDSELSFPLSFEKTELTPVPQVSRVENLKAVMNSYPSDDGFIVKVCLVGDVYIFTSDGKEKKKPFHSEDYLTICTNEEESDLPSDKGRYDFLPALKAFFYSAVPLRENNPDYKRDGEGYRVLTQEEYLAEKNAKKEDGETYKPFADLKKKLAAAEKKKKPKK